MNDKVDAEFVTMLQSVIDSLTLERDNLSKCCIKLTSRNVELETKNAELRRQIDNHECNLW